MARNAGRKPSRKKSARRAYLVRSYDETLVPGSSAGYYFSQAEAEEEERVLEERYPRHLFSIEVFQVPALPKQGSGKRKG